MKFNLKSDQGGPSWTKLDKAKPSGESETKQCHASIGAKQGKQDKQGQTGPNRAKWGQAETSGTKEGKEKPSGDKQGEAGPSA